jgi:NADH:ubiquinone oxidoreductase subunit C
MTVLETVQESPAITDKVSDLWTEKGGVFWLNYTDLDVREVAVAMNALRARFITITAYQLPKDEGLRLEYHWDIDGRLLGFKFPLAGKSIESIFDLCEAVDWIEREVHEGFAVDFIGREYEPLLLREGNTCGVNLRETGAPGKPASGLLGQEEVAK